MTDPRPLPAAFLERMHALLGEEFAEFQACLNRPPVQGLRINTLKSSVPEGQRLLSWPLEPVPWCPSGFRIDSDIRAGKHPLHAAGLYYVQEPAAMAAAELLDVRPGHWVIDIAASPGGKSTHIASLLNGQGFLVANDPVRGRIKALGENLERWGVRNAIMTNAQPQDLAKSMPEMFDRVLVDAPCSGEGMFRKSPIAIREWSEEHVHGCAIRQAALLGDACKLIRPGGLLLYCTCTFAPEENEQQVDRFLKSHPHWELETITQVEGFTPGRPAWAAGGHDLDRMARLWPHLAQAEGHTFALLRAPGEDHTSISQKATSGKAREPLQVSALWDDFRVRALPSFAGHGVVEQRGDNVSLLPPDAPSFAGILVIRAGLPLGTVRGNRFEPAHGLAMALRAEELTEEIELTAEEAHDYLKGASIRRAGDPGWKVMTLAGLPLGWGKRSSDIVKNHYPKGLRWH